MTQQAPDYSTTTPQRGGVLGVAARTLSTRDGCRRMVIFIGLATFALAAWHAGQTYFRSDEWAYWTVRRDFLEAGGLKNLGHFFFSPHGGSIPAGIVAIWLPLDWIFGMHWYLPYAIPSMALHVLGGFALFELLVRHLWPAVALGASALFLIMGNAASGIAYGWMVGYIAALSAGFVALYVMERIGGKNDRLVVGTTLAAVLVAIAFTGVGLAIVVMVSAAYALRGRVRLALLHVAVVAVPFIGWRLFYKPPAIELRIDEIGTHLSFMWNGFITAAGDLVAIPWLGAVVVAAAVGGAGWSWRERGDLWVVNVATLVGAVFFYGLVAVRAVDLRAHSFSYDQDRYLYIAAALLIPSIAWLVSRLISVRSWVAAPMVLLMLWAVPLNVLQAMDSYDTLVELGQTNRVTVETAASLVGHLDPLEAGFLVADRSARFTVEQFERLDEQGKVPCVADLDLAVTFAQRQGMPAPTAGQVSCGR